MEEKKRQPAKITLDNGKMNITYNVLTIRDKDENAKHIDCFVPAFNLKFSTTSEDNIFKYSNAMVSSYFNYFLKKENFKAMIVEIHKLGFRTNQHNFVMHQLLNKKKRNAKFSIDNVNIPEGFEGSKVMKNSLSEMVY
ncbi:hypothetical protein [Flavobacterium sp.]|uniref:hypothetical protein n=1 Tax=Flavobacterium sp. TaxID=239 RepID=UPI0040471196